MGRETSKNKRPSHLVVELKAPFIFHFSKKLNSSNFMPTTPKLQKRNSSWPCNQMLFISNIAGLSQAVLAPCSRQVGRECSKEQEILYLMVELKTFVLHFSISRNFHAISHPPHSNSRAQLVATGTKRLLFRKDHVPLFTVLAPSMESTSGGGEDPSPLWSNLNFSQFSFSISQNFHPILHPPHGLEMLLHLI